MAGKPRDIEAHDATAMGVWTHHSEMPDGELRFRLKHDDGTAYSRTEATVGGGWQKSHSHRTVRETYITQRGRMALAELIDEALENTAVRTQRDLHHRAEYFTQRLPLWQRSDPHREARRRGQRQRLVPEC